MKRREFFQESSHLLTLLGASWLGGSKSGFANPLFIGSEKAISAPNRRKLALLVGIDKYSSPLAGCVTDVELQKELLIYRFGFSPSDIVTLTDDRASREQIELAFAEHLVKQAKNDDLVIFHFSGYGSQVSVAEKVQNALVTLETSGVDYIEWDSLQGLMRSLSTQKIVTVIDASFSTSPTPSSPNLRWRTFPDTQELKGLPSAKLPGILLQATSSGLVAAERNWGGFTAGVFTYNLTQQLWAIADAAQVTFQKTAAQIDEILGKWQKPSWEGDKNRDRYLIEAGVPSPLILGAEGAVISAEDRPNYVKVWLGGLPTQSIASYGINSLFATISEPPYAPIILQIKSREGAIAKAKVRSLALHEVQSLAETDSLLNGKPIQEAVRFIPRQIGLTIGLNPELERIERVDATSALGNIASVTSVVNAGEQSADYWLGKQKNVNKSGEVSDNYALFNLMGESALDTVGKGNEAIKLAANRFKQPLDRLLAAKIWQMTENETTSRLAVRASLETVENKAKKIDEKRSQRANLSDSQLFAPNSSIPNISLQTSLRYKIENLSDRPIYWLIVGVDSARNPIVWQPSTEAIAPGSSRIVPEPNSDALWLTPTVSGIAQNYVICSIAPFEKAIAAIEAQIKGKGLTSLPKPLEVAQAILVDLHQGSVNELTARPLPILAETLSGITDAYTLDVNSWATLKFTYQCT